MSTNARWRSRISRSARSRRCGRPATPRNYEIWYVYATGYNPSLNQKINETLEASGTLAEPSVEQYLRRPIIVADALDRPHRRGRHPGQGEIEQVMAMIDAAAGTASTLHRKPRRHVGEARPSKDREGLRTIVESLVQTAKEMEVPTRSWKSG